MNKKFFSVILFGAFMCASTSVFVSCKDYDDDIDNLQTQIDSNKNAIAQIESQIKSGQWVSNVSSTANGITVTLGNGQSFNINNGKDGAPGNAGTEGLTPQIIVEDGFIKVSHDNGATFTNLIALSDLKGEKGNDGNAGAAPEFSVGNDGHLYVQYGDDESTKKDLGLSINGIFYVENGVTLEIHMPKQLSDGTSEDGIIKLPLAASIVSIEAVNYSWDDAGMSSVTLYYGKAAADVEFNGKTYTKGQFLSSASQSIRVKVNPTMADASKYNFYLTDSKGNSPFVITKVENNMSVDPITRATEPTPNKGLYNMTIGFGSDFDVNNVPNEYIAYCIATKDFYGNELLSKYDVRVNASQSLDGLYPMYVSAVVGKEVNLDDYISGSAVDWKYSLPMNLTASAEALGLNLKGSIVSAEKAGNITIKVEFLRNDGTIGSANVGLTFTQTPVEGNISDFVWTMTDEAGKNKVEVNVDAIAGYLSGVATLAPTYAYANGTAADYNGVDAGAGIAPISIEQKTDDYGYSHYIATMTFDVTTVVPTKQIATLVLPANGNLPEQTVKFNVIINNATSAFAFQPLAAFFNADKTAATAYGNSSGAKIAYDLYDLFKEIDPADQANIVFAETKPADTEIDGVPTSANNWLTSGSEISVDKYPTYGGAYQPREIKVSYQPFGNPNAASIDIVFNLTIKSELAEGTLTYVKADDPTKAGVTKEVDGGTSATLVASEILAKDVFGVKYNLVGTPDPRIDNIEVILGDQNAKDYLSITGDLGSSITISKKASATAITTPPTCNVTVNIKDTWGKVTSVNIPVKVVR